MINNYPIKMVGRTKVEINDNQFNITSGFQKVFTNKSYGTANSMNDMEKILFRNILQKTTYNNQKREKGPISGPDRYIQNKLDDDVRKILNLDKQLKGRGVEKIIKPSNITDIYTKIEVLLGLKLSGHTNTLTEASNLIDELHQRGGLQNKQQYRNAPNKFSTPQMELPSKFLEKRAFNTRPKLEEHILIVVDNSTHEELLSQPLQTNKQFKIAITFLTGYNGIFNITNSNNRFYFIKSITVEGGYIILTYPHGA